MANTYYDSQLTAEEIEEVLESINGILTQANNGKVLAISNGKFEARSVQWGGGEPIIEPLSVTQNGTYTAPAGVDGYSPVIVNVSGSTGVKTFVPNAKPIISTGESVSDIRVTMDFLLLSNESGGIFGSLWATNGFFLMIYNNKFRFHSGNSVVDMETVVVGNNYEIDCGYDYCIINGTTYNLSPSAANSGNLNLFTPRNSQANSVMLAVKECSIYRNNVLQQHFIPDSSNAMLETVSGIAFPNTGTGTLIEI